MRIIKRIEVMMDIRMNFPALGRMVLTLSLPFSIIDLFVTLVLDVSLGSDSVLSQMRGAFPISPDLVLFE